MKNSDQRRSALLGFTDQLQHGVSVGHVQSCRRLVKQQHRIGKDEAAGDIDPLLFAPGEGQR